MRDPAFPAKREFRFLWKWPKESHINIESGYHTWWVLVLGRAFQLSFDILNEPKKKDGSYLLGEGYREFKLTFFSHWPFGFHRICFDWRHDKG
jgi:hypothetical protein